MSNVRCPKCGEEYSDTYRKCPFCEEEAAIKQGKPLRRRGGKRLDKKKRSSGAGGVMLLVMAVVILGVVGFVFFGDQVADFMGIRMEQGEDQPAPPEGQDALPGKEEDPQPQPEDGDGQVQPSGEQEPGQDPEAEEPTVPQEPAGPLALEFDTITIPAGETARLNLTGGTGEVAWSTSNENIAVVDGGAVTGKAGGTVTITAVSGEETVTCTVTVTGDPWVNPVKLSLNRTDFTMSSGDSTWQMKVKGTDSKPVWASNNTNVVTISDTGLVTKVGKGTTTITATVDGQVLECIVRVS